MTSKVIVPFVLFVAVSTLAACGSDPTAASAKAQVPNTAAATSAPVVDVAAARAVRSTIQSTLELSGTLTPRTRVGVKPKLPGRLERVLVDRGDRVQAGQVVATIDRRELDAQVDAAEASVAVAQAAIESADAALANATLEQGRAKTLFESGAMPRQRLDAAETALKAAAAQRNLAQANLAQAQAAVRRAREVQRDATLTAPVSGYIVERNYDAGAIPGDLPIVVVADIRELKLEAGVSELEAGRLKTGLRAAVSVQAKPGEQFNGQLAAIAPEVDARNRHFQVDVRVDNSKGTLLAGMYATARIVLDAVDQAIVVPREAITAQNTQRVAFKIDGEKLTPVAVVEGLNDGRQVQIVSGLTAGDQVLADARRQLPAGSRVKAVEVSSEPSPKANVAPEAGKEAAANANLSTEAGKKSAAKADLSAEAGKKPAAKLDLSTEAGKKPAAKLDLSTEAGKKPAAKVEGR
jgi:RND family efflux transporter MFP subunit